MMPNRVIKESIKRSPQIDSLTWFEETVFYRLIVTVDDYGCFDGRPILIKNELFPTRENVTRKSVEDAITKLVAVGLLYQYEVDGRPYLAFPTWDKHQRIRNKHRKYPAPPDDMNLSAIRGQTTAISQPESNPNPNTNPNTNPSNFCAEPETVSAPVFALPLNDGRTVSCCRHFAGFTRDERLVECKSDKAQDKKRDSAVCYRMVEPNAEQGRKQAENRAVWKYIR